jgi:hypothetical protein
MIEIGEDREGTEDEEEDQENERTKMRKIKETKSRAEFNIRSFLTTLMLISREFRR